jgi:hypothetical protein
VEVLGGAPGEIRVGEGIGAATFARASLRRAIVSPEGIASKHRNPKPTKPIAPIELTAPTELTGPIKLTAPIELTGPIKLTAPIELTGPIKPTSRRLLTDRPSDR